MGLPAMCAHIRLCTPTREEVQGHTHTQTHTVRGDAQSYMGQLSPAHGSRPATAPRRSPALPGQLGEPSPSPEPGLRQSSGEGLQLAGSPGPPALL